MLKSRIESCEAIAAELDDAAEQITEETTADEIQSLVSGISWSYE